MISLARHLLPILCKPTRVVGTTCTEQMCKCIYCKFIVNYILTGVDCYKNTNFITVSQAGSITVTHRFHKPQTYM